jgi:cysteine synthase A
MKIFADNSQAIGNTPLVRFNRIKGTNTNNIIGKVEGRNPAYSVKCRVASGIVSRAIECGELKEGMEILEATSGNTGIGLAYVGAALGFPVKIVMPDNLSVERKLMMKAFGAELVLTDGSKGMTGSVAMADEMMKRSPGKYFLADQFRNPANPLVHEKTTGPEIFEDTDGNVDIVVSAVGTGGTITGIARYLKMVQKKEVMIIGVEPSKSPVISQFMKGEELTPGLHGIQGIGAGFIPDVLDLSLIDHILQVEDSNAIEYARRLATDEGIICGISSGAAVFGALQAIDKFGLEGKNIVVILPDSGERYLSAGLF